MISRLIGAVISGVLNHQPTPAYSTEQLAKYLIFTMLLKEIRDGVNRSLSTYDFMLWAQEWMQPEWLVGFDYSSGEVRFEHADSGHQLFQHVGVFEKNDVRRHFGRINQTEQQAVGRCIDELAQSISLPEDSLAQTYELLKGVKISPEIDENIRASWIHLTRLHGLGEYDEVKKLVKYLVFSVLMLPTRFGRIKPSLAEYCVWCMTWLAPEFYVMWEPGTDCLQVIDISTDSPSIVFQGEIDALLTGNNIFVLCLRNSSQQQRSDLLELMKAVGKSIRLPLGFLTDIGEIYVENKLIDEWGTKILL